MRGIIHQQKAKNTAAASDWQQANGGSAAVKHKKETDQNAD